MERLRLGEVPDHRHGAALGDAPGFLVVAHQRGDVVTAAHERVEHGRANVTGCASEEDPHGNGTAYFRSRPNRSGPAHADTTGGVRLKPSGPYRADVDVAAVIGAPRKALKP